MIIVLAGGLASRLPNKPLLPVIDGLAIEHSLRLGRLAKVVVPPNSAIPHVLRARGWMCQFVVQEEPTGMMDAVRLCKPTGPTVISCCDNIFTKPLPPFRGPAWAGIGLYPSWAEKSLATYSNGVYGRNYPPTADFAAVLGPGWFPEGEILQNTVGSEWTDVLTQLSIAPQRCEGVWDIGTPTSYRKYWMEARASS